MISSTANNLTPSTGAAAIQPGMGPIRSNLGTGSLLSAQSGDCASVVSNFCDPFELAHDSSVASGRHQGHHLSHNNQKLVSQSHPISGSILVGQSPGIVGGQQQHPHHYGANSCPTQGVGHQQLVVEQQFPNPTRSPTLGYAYTHHNQHQHQSHRQSAQPAPIYHHRQQQQQPHHQQQQLQLSQHQPINQQQLGSQPQHQQLNGVNVARNISLSSAQGYQMNQIDNQIDSANIVGWRPSQTHQYWHESTIETASTTYGWTQATQAIHHAQQHQHQQHHQQQSHHHLNHQHQQYHHNPSNQVQNHPPASGYQLVAGQHQQTAYLPVVGGMMSGSSPKSGSIGSQENYFGLSEGGQPATVVVASNPFGVPVSSQQLAGIKSTPSSVHSSSVAPSTATKTSGSSSKATKSKQSSSKQPSSSTSSSTSMAKTGTNMATAAAAAAATLTGSLGPCELEDFAERFKQRRIKLGVTQADVGKALATLQLPGVGSLSQSTICRFESLTLSHNNMIALRPILQAWLESAESQALQAKTLQQQQQQQHGEQISGLYQQQSVTNASSEPAVRFGENQPTNRLSKSMIAVTNHSPSILRGFSSQGSVTPVDSLKNENAKLNSLNDEIRSKVNSSDSPLGSGQQIGFKRKAPSSSPVELLATSDDTNSQRRISIAANEKQQLESHFAQVPKPNSEQLQSIAEKLDLDKNTVRIWFCNQRQKQKRLKQNNTSNNYSNDDEESEHDMYVTSPVMNDYIGGNNQTTTDNTGNIMTKD